MKTLMTAAAATALIAGSAWGQQSAELPANIEKLQNMQSTGVKDFTTVEQTGEYADGIKKTLERIKMPTGFKIELYAIVPDARHMAVGPQGIVTFVGTRKDKVWAVTDRNKDRVADEVKDFAPSLTVHHPERRLLLARRLPLHRRAEPRTGVPGGRVLLRKPRRRGGPGRAAGRADPARTRKASTTPRGSATSGRTASSTSRSASRTT